MPELPVGPKKCILHHVFRILLVAGHPERESKRTAAVPLDERAERLAVALARTGQDGCRLGHIHSIT
jgi:hypothetical protein